MRHADHDLVYACLAALLDQIVQHRNQALPALEGEALLANVARMQITLDTLGPRQLFENP